MGIQLVQVLTHLFEQNPVIQSPCCYELRI